MKVFVKSVLGNHWELSNLAGQNTQIRHLKQLLRFQTGIQLDTQQLLYKGSVLQDYATLESCGILDGATVQLVLKLGTGL